MKVRIHGSVIDYLNREAVVWTQEERDLLARLSAERRRRDGSFEIELANHECWTLRTFAGWVVHKMSTRKKNPGPERGLYNSAVALARRLDVRQEATR